MTSPWRYLCGMLLLAGLALPAPAADHGPQPDAPAAPKTAKTTAKPGATPKVNSALKGYYAMMVHDLNLDAAQQAVLAEKVQARHAQLEAWTQENGPKVEAAKKALEEARKGNDKEATARARAELKALTDAQTRLEEEGKAGILAVLTPAQREQWAGMILYRTHFTSRYKAAELTPEQITRIKALCVEAAREIARHNPADKQEAGVILELKGRLVKDVQEKVLTAEQRAKLSAPASEKTDKKPTP